MERPGKANRQQVAEQTDDDVARGLARFLYREDVSDPDPDLWEALDASHCEAPPTDRLQRSRMAEAARAVRLLPLGSPAEAVIEHLQTLWEGLQAEGLDRSVVRPESRAPSITDLELVCWELVVTPEMAATGSLPDPAGWGAPPTARPLPLPLGV